MLWQCGGRVNVVAVGSSGGLPADASLVRELARLIRDKTPTNVLHLVEPGTEAGATASGHLPAALAEILRKSDRNITFVLLTGGSDLVRADDLAALLLENGGGKGPPDYVDAERLESALQRIEAAIWGILGARDAYSPNTVVVTLTGGKGGGTTRPEGFGPAFLAPGHRVREILEESEVPDEHRDGILELLSLRFREAVSGAISGGPVSQEGILVVPTEDIGPTGTGIADAAQRILATIASRCPNLFGPDNEAEGARRCQLQP